MIQAVKFDNKIFFEIETINGIKYLKKEDKKASKRAGEPKYIMKPFNEIINSNLEVVYLK